MRFLKVTTPFFLISTISSFGQTLIDVIFPDGTGTNPAFTEIDNNVGTTNTWTQADGTLVTSTNANSTTGAVSETTIDFSALGTDALTLSVNVDSGTLNNLSANGLFIGFQDSNNPDGSIGLWNNHNPSFGFWMSGGSQGTGQREVAVGGNPSSGRNQEAAYGIATVASIQDGFDITLTIDSIGWSLEVDGLLDAAGEDLTGGSGTWETSTQQFEGLTADMHVGISVQTPLNDAGGITLSGINLTQGPSTGGNNNLDIVSFSFNDDVAAPATSITWTSDANTLYILEYSLNLEEGQWVEVDDSIMGEGQTTTFDHNFAARNPELIGVQKLFYRVQTAQN